MMIQYDPTDIFEQNSAKGGVNEIKQNYARAFGIFANYTLVPAVTGKKIRVLSYVVADFAAALGYVVFETATVVMYPPIWVAANSQVISEESTFGWFETLAGNALTVSSGAAGVDVFVRYIEVTPGS